MMNKAQKWLALMVAIGGVASLVGTYSYLPNRLAKIEELHAKDHDTLVELKADVKHIDRKLERNGIVYENVLKENAGLFVVTNHTVFQHGMQNARN